MHLAHVLCGRRPRRRLATYNGTSWSTPLSVDNNSSCLAEELNSVSCSSAIFCAAVDGFNVALTGSWNSDRFGDEQVAIAVRCHISPVAVQREALSAACADKALRSIPKSRIEDTDTACEMAPAEMSAFSSVEIDCCGPPAS